MTDEVEAGRDFCLRCRRPGSFCVCRHLPSIDHATEVVILQHKREHPHPLNTAKLVRLALNRCRLHVMRDDDAPIELPDSLNEAERGAIERGVYEAGMSRDAVFLAIGYPPKSLNPSESASLLSYEARRFVRRNIQFGDDDRVVER